LPFKPGMVLGEPAVSGTDVQSKATEAAAKDVDFKTFESDQNQP